MSSHMEWIHLATARYYACPDSSYYIAAVVFAEPPKVLASRYPRFKVAFKEESVGVRC